MLLESRSTTVDQNKFIFRGGNGSTALSVQYGIKRILYQNLDVLQENAAPEFMEQIQEMNREKGPLGCWKPEGLTENWA